MGATRDRRRLSRDVRSAQPEGGKEAVIDLTGGDDEGKEAVIDLTGHDDV